MSEPSPSRCPRCNASVAADQEYCLECGSRLARDRRSGPVEGFSAGSARRNVWVVPVFLGLVIAVFGTGAAIAISGEREEPNAVSTATGGSLTVTDDGSTLTAPEQTEPTKTAARTTTLPRTTTPKSCNPGGDYLASRPARLDDRAPLAAAGEQARGCDREGRRGAQGRSPSRRRSRLRPLCEPPPRLLRSLLRRLRLRGGGGERAAASPGGVPGRVSARDHPLSNCPSLLGVGNDAAGQTRSRPTHRARFVDIDANNCKRLCNRTASPYTRCRQPRRNLIFGLYMGQNRER